MSEIYVYQQLKDKIVIEFLKKILISCIPSSIIAISVSIESKKPILNTYPSFIATAIVSLIILTYYRLVYEKITNHIETIFNNFVVKLIENLINKESFYEIIKRNENKLNDIFVPFAYKGFRNIVGYYGAIASSIIVLSKIENGNGRPRVYCLLEQKKLTRIVDGVQKEIETSIYIGKQVELYECPDDAALNYVKNVLNVVNIRLSPAHHNVAKKIQFAENAPDVKQVPRPFLVLVEEHPLLTPDKKSAVLAGEKVHRSGRPITPQFCRFFSFRPCFP